MLRRTAAASVAQKGFEDALVFVGEHHGEDARRHGRICGIGGERLHLAIVIVDLPKISDAANLDDAKVVFAMGIIVLVEGYELSNLPKKRSA
jgi:hypothetical protein